MKKRYFNFKLYIDAIKQLKLIGLMSLVILILQAILIPVGNNISIISHANNSSTIYTRSILAYNVLLPLCFCIVAPLMTLYLFNFLNKRNSSDFYLSFPDTRICLSISFFLAIVTWLAVIILVTSGTSLITISLLSRCEVILESIPQIIFYIFAGSVFVSAATFIAMGITGTNLSNIVVALLIIFLPRTLITLMVSMSQSIMPFIEFNISGTLLSNRYNAVSDMLINLLLGVGDTTTIFTDTNAVISGVYTMIIGIIYSILGVVLFNFRKSESAGNPALNKWVQLVIRTIIAMMICILPLYGIINTFVLRINNNDDTSNDIFLIAVFYIIAIVIYFLYELITTKKWRNVIKAIPGLLVLFIMNIAFGLIVMVIYNINLHNPINENNIEYVQILDQDYANVYFSEQAEKIKLKDANINKIISDTLNRSIENWKEHRMLSNLENNITIIKTVKIKANGKFYGRNISMTQEEYQNIFNTLYAQPEYKEILKKLPRAENVEINGISDISLTNEQLINVYNIFNEEIQTLPLTVADLRYIYGLDARADNSIRNMNIVFFIDNSWNNLDIKIDNKLPKTSALWNQYIQDSVNNQISNTAISQDEILASLNQFVQNSNNNTEANANISNIDLNFYYYDETNCLRMGDSIYLSSGDNEAIAYDYQYDVEMAGYINEDISILSELIPCLQNNVGTRTITNNDIIIKIIISGNTSYTSYKEQLFILPKEQLAGTILNRIS